MVYIRVSNSQSGLQDTLHIVTRQENGLCDHLYGPALTSQGSYATASGVSRKREGDKTRCGRNHLVIAEDVEPQGARELFL